MIKLRIDVDYPYPSRWQSFLYTILTIKTSKNYLRNAKIIARMINESPEDVKATWFFNPNTIPDRELLDMMKKKRHEVALHIANRPSEELHLLEKATRRKVRYYTTHGTAKLLARIIWKRWKARTPEIPKNFPLQSFYKFPTLGLDRLCYANCAAKAVKIVEKSITKGKVLHIHPEWLFQRGTINYRGPFYEALRRILKVDNELETISARKRIFFKVARDTQEYTRDVIPTDDFIKKLGEKGIDIFTFIERRWCNTVLNPSCSWFEIEDNIALLRVATYDYWWKKIGKKTRNMVRKGEKIGVKTEIVKPSEKLAEGIWKIYNEIPIRQEREFPHYGIQLREVVKGVYTSKNCIYIGAYFQEELVGFIQLEIGHDIALISQILSLQKHWDKAVNNSLVAKAVEFCAKNKIKWIMYGRIGNHPSLDKFKRSNGFSKFAVNRYYAPITKKGQIALWLRLNREIKDVLPQSMKQLLIPIYNWISRIKMRLKFFLSS